MKNMTPIKIFLLGCTMVLSITACYKNGGELTITDDPPVVHVDTTVFKYATNLKVGDITMPADTVFGLATFQPGGPVLYGLDFELEGMQTGSIFWASLNQSQPQLMEGNHNSILVAMITDSSVSLVETWILHGMDINFYPSVVIDFFPADSIEIAISDVALDIRRDTLQTGAVMVVDRAMVALSGHLSDPISGQIKEVSGNFTCNFSRPE